MGKKRRANVNEYTDAFTVDWHLNMGTLMLVKCHVNLSEDVERHLSTVVK